MTRIDADGPLWTLSAAPWAAATPRDGEPGRGRPRPAWSGPRP